MWNKKNQLIIIVVIILAFIGYYGSRTEQDKMLDAVAEHDHENALFYAQKILALEPANSQAQKVVKESGRILYYLQQAQSIVAKFKRIKKDESSDLQRLMAVLKKSGAYLQKARLLDPNYQKTLAFAAVLDDANKELINLLALNIVKQGKSSVTIAATHYQKTTKLINSAASSGYIAAFLSVQSAWATVGPPVHKIKNQISETIASMENSRNILSRFKGNHAEALAKSLTLYIKAVADTIEVLLFPKGSYNDFTRLGSSATSGYEAAESQLQDIIPRSYSSTEDYADIIRPISEFKLYENDSIRQFIADQASFDQASD